MNQLNNLLNKNLNERIKLVTEDYNSEKDEYASIDTYSLAKALGLPLNAINGSGKGNWAVWGYYGYVFLDENKNLVNSLDNALNELYNEDSSCSKMATFDVNDNLRFEASLNGDYSNIDDLLSPYQLRKKKHIFWYWDESDFHKKDGNNFKKLTELQNINEVWIEAIQDSNSSNGLVKEFEQKFNWLKNNLTTKFHICVFRFYNDED